MNPIISEKYFTFQEILDLYPAHAPRFPHDAQLADDWFMKMLEDAGLEPAIYTLSDAFPDSLLAEIINALMTIVYYRHDEDYLYKVSQMAFLPSYTLTQADFKRAIKKVINVIDLTIPRYAPILQQNENYSTDPVAKIGSVTTGKSRFNDTPQDGGNFNDDPHATNVSHSVSESEVDSGSIVSRLDEMFKGFRSIILEWSNEFDQLFLKEEQL